MLSKQAIEFWQTFSFVSDTRGKSASEFTAAIWQGFLRDIKDSDTRNQYIRVLMLLPLEVKSKFLEAAITPGKYIFNKSDKSSRGSLKTFAVKCFFENESILLVGQLYENVHPQTLRNFAIGVFQDCNSGNYTTELNDNYDRCLSIAIDLKGKEPAKLLHFDREVL